MRPWPAFRKRLPGGFGLDVIALTVEKRPIARAISASRFVATPIRRIAAPTQGPPQHVLA